jgi:adenosylmethionine-8-amino-7-oxononanoate aminotransferase
VPSIESGVGVWLTTVDGRRILDACSGGAMVASLGHGVRELAAAASEQAEKISYFYNHHFTSEPQERLADRLLGLTPEMARVRFVSGGSEANETALQLARLYHVDRGDTDRWRVISPAQSYHGSSMGPRADRTAGAPGAYTPYLASHLHIRRRPGGPMTGEAALAELDRLLEQHGRDRGVLLRTHERRPPSCSPPERFWHGLARPPSGTGS